MIGVANRLSETVPVDLVLIRRSGPFLSEVGPRVNIVDLGAGKVRKALLPLRRYMRHARPDLLVSAGLATDLPALVGKAVFRWPTHLHISFQNNPTASAGLDETTPHWPLMIKTFYRFGNSYSAISNGVARSVERLLGKSEGALRVIHNPVDIGMVARRAAERPEHPWLAEKSGPVILAAGRLVRQKDFSTLLKAFASVHGRRSDARLIIIGEGGERDRLEAEAASLGVSEAVSFPGFSANPFSAMAAADVFALSSQWEGFANVVAEAIACGTSVVSTDCPSGPAEILEDGRWGLLVPPGDAEAMAAALLNSLETPADPAALKRRAQAFALESTAEEYREMFRRLGVSV